MIMIIFKAIFVAGSFLLFVISSGLWFEQFRKYSLAVVLAGLFTLYAALETLGFPAGHWLTSTWQEAYVLVQGISSRKGEAPMAVEVPKPTSTPLQAQSVLSDCPLCPELVLIKPGTFTMGTSDQEPGYQAREAPPHTVRIAEPFYLGRYKVTFDEWDKCVSEGGCDGYHADDSGWGRGKRPVINVSWDDAQNFIAWLSKKTQHRYRLPSEAEWEYAARAGSAAAYSFDGPPSLAKANYRDGNPQSPGGYGTQTVPVDLFPPNMFGLYQVHGNAFEWVEDCWRPDYTLALQDQTPNYGGECDLRVIRGGSWFESADGIRSAARVFGRRDARNNRRGFRVARTAP